MFLRRRASTVLVTIATILLRSFSCSDSKKTSSTSFLVYPLFITSVRNVLVFTQLSGGAPRLRRRFHSCARRPQRRSRCLVPRRVAPAPGLANPALLWVVTLRSPWRHFQIFAPGGNINYSCLAPPSFPSCIKTTLSQGPRLEHRKPSRRSSRDPLSAKRVQLGLKPGDQEFVRDEASFPVMASASHHMLEDTRFSTVFSGCVRLPFG